ncbi:hypothetical protein [Streptomyces rubiginosohelvolus]
MSVVVFLFLIAAAFLVVALVGPYRLYWRSRPRAAGQPLDGSLALGRVAAFGVAGAFAFGGCSVLGDIDQGAWSAGEVRKAAEDVALSPPGGADSVVRMRVTESKSAGGGVFVPGADGGSGDSIARYDLSATVDNGPC